ncbi:MAG: baseplate J/gp47 family protein [Ruminococcus sp.]|nr:baseplate J/gp47 family protein [Ruminococcus sp.]
MQIPMLDSRKEKDILKAIEKLAKSYTPEWNADFSHPDAGTALAAIFAQMHMGTIRRLNLTAEKNRTAFCRFIGTELRPSEPASGYVQFGLSSDDPDKQVLVPAGTVVTADMPEDETQKSGFTTQDDVCVTNSFIQHIFMTDGRADTIHHVYDSDRQEESPHFTLFRSETPDLNRHVIWIGCRSGMLNMSETGNIQLILPEKSDTNQQTLAERLEKACLNGQLLISYYAESGWIPFTGCMAEGEALYLQKPSSQPLFAKAVLHGEEAYWIRLSLLDIRMLPEANAEKLLFSVSGDAILPDVQLTKQGIAEDFWFYPFGEEPALYDAFYIASDEVLCKAGAQIIMQFTIEYAPLPPRKAVEKPVSDWKMIMKKSDIRIEEEAIAFIKQVSWEYFNGRGWKTLPCSTEMKKAFCPIDGKRTYQLEFICPTDLQPVIAEAEERRFIRARILNMEQTYQMNTIYRAPLISGVVFHYHCVTPCIPDVVQTEDHMVLKRWNPQEPIALFSDLPQKEPALYLGFSAPLEGGPFRLLIALEKQLSGRMPELRWEYMSAHGWERLRCYDDTGQLAHTGFVTISGNTGFARAELFQKKLYWIRVTDADAAYCAENAKQLCPAVFRMDMNCTEIQNQQTAPPEFFSMETAVPHYTCTLSRKNICTAEVWVNEITLHSTAEIEQLRQAGLADPEYDNYGVLQRVWVKWNAVEQFYSSNAEDRHYRIDRNEGMILFGDGVYGRIPCSGKGDCIRISYTTGGGRSGNLPAGRITGSQYALGLVTKIINPLPLSGGNDMEQVPVALDRTADDLRNGGCCVTVQDYEQLARRIERSILKVKCAAGYNADGEKEAGSVTLLIMRSDFTKEGLHFYQIREKLLREMNRRRAVSLTPGSCYITHPSYVKLCVTAEILAADSGKIFRIKEQVLQRITAFLHPITGNFDGNGWEIGVLPHIRQIENVIYTVSGISHVKNIMVRGFSVQDHEQNEIDLNHLSAVSTFFIAVSGTHEIHIETGLQ